MTSTERYGAVPGGLAAPDAAVRKIVQLLGVVAGEDQVLARLERCVAELNAIARARGELTSCTDSELSEAQAWAGRTAEPALAQMLPGPTEGVLS